MRRSRNTHDSGFTLVEMLTVVGVIGVLLGVVLPTVSSVRVTQRKTAEMAAARQLMVAYIAYATDNDDLVLPGHKAGLRARDDHGHVVQDEPASRYPWRIAPYLSSSIDALYLGSQRELLEEARQTGEEEYVYTISLSPSLGLNATWVGGHQGAGQMGFDQRFIDAVGRFYVSYISEVRSPAQLLVFASARGEDPLTRGVGPVEGFHRVQSPRFLASDGDRWSETFDPQDLPADFGFVSPRHDGLAVTAFADGHVDALGDPGLRDMRHWANWAKTSDYGLEPRH